MSRRRWDVPNNDFKEFNKKHRHRHSGPINLFDLLFGLISMCISIAVGVVGIVFNVLGAVLSGGPNKGPRPPVDMNADSSCCQDNNSDNTRYGDINKFDRSNPGEAKQSYTASAGFNSSNHSTSQQQAQSEKAGAERKEEHNKASEAQKSTSKEQPKKEDKAKKEDKSTSDWNIAIFVLTLVPVIILLAVGQLFWAGISVAAGIVITIIYNFFKGIANARRQKAAKLEAELAQSESEDSETEKLIKEAFDKVYVIRKNLVKVSNEEIRLKVDNLCGMSEKIIGEVRINPENMKLVKKFFYYYLDAFNDIFNRYLRIASFSNSSEDIDKTIAETEKSFDDIENVFKELLESLIESDMLNIKATINVIKNS